MEYVVDIGRQCEYLKPINEQKTTDNTHFVDVYLKGLH